MHEHLPEILENVLQLHAREKITNQELLDITWQLQYEAQKHSKDLLIQLYFTPLSEKEKKLCSTPLVNTDLGENVCTRMHKLGIHYVGELLPFSFLKNKHESKYGKSIHAFLANHAAEHLIGTYPDWEPPYHNQFNPLQENKFYFLYSANLPLWLHIFWCKRQKIHKITHLNRTLELHGYRSGFYIEAWLKK